MGPEKLDNGVYYIRSLIDLADMARAKHDGRTRAWAMRLARKLQRQFETTWWSAPNAQYADSLTDPGNVQSFQKHWIGQVPMEAELTSRGRVTPGVASLDHGTTALAGRENPCYSGDRRGSRGLYHTGCEGGQDHKGDFEIFSLTTSIQAVGEGNYGRLGPDQQQRYTDANAETMFSEPATGGTPDEQPGAMPEIFPSAPKDDPTKGIPPNIDRCWTCRSMFMQAWGNYGTAWSVVHQQLGVRPDVGRGFLAVVPQVPDGQPLVRGTAIRLGRSGQAAVEASHADNVYRTRVQVGAPISKLAIGHTLPAGSRVGRVMLDGRRVRPRTRMTNRGLEVTANTRPGHAHAGRDRALVPTAGPTPPRRERRCRRDAGSPRAAAAPPDRWAARAARAAPSPPARRRTAARHWQPPPRRGVRGGDAVPPGSCRNASRPATRCARRKFSRRPSASSGAGEKNSGTST